MGCTSCGSGGGTPKGCQNKGTCSSGGCNKLGVFDWLANMQLPNGQKPYDIIEVRFKNGRKNFYRNTKEFSLQVGDVVVLEASPGHDVGVVSIVGELARIQVLKKAQGVKPSEFKKVYRIANQEDIDKWIKARDLEKEVMYQSRTLAVNLNLNMKISDVEYQGDLTKATFYYTADDRVDFRQLIKDMAEKFRIRIEMRQIGSRQEASRLGGIGSCGRELCCSTWLTDFRSVSTAAARYQQLSLNPQKLAGQCGKLKCCLNYELDMYLDAIKSFPSIESKLHTEKGVASHVKTDVFKRLMWYSYDGETGLIALSPERVAEIKELNQNRVKPHDLIDFAAQDTPKRIDYANDLDNQDSLNRFDKNFKKPKKKKKGKPVSGTARVEVGRKKGAADNSEQTERAVRDNRSSQNTSAGAAKSDQPREKRNNQRNRKPELDKKGDKNNGQQGQTAAPASEERKKEGTKNNNRRRRPPRKDQQNTQGGTTSDN